MTIVLMSWAEMMNVANAGVLRTCLQRGDGAHALLQHGAHVNWNVDIYGACAEAAVAKLLGRHWTLPVGYDPKAADVGDNTEVKFTQHLQGGLAIPRKDADRVGRSFVLVRLAPPHPDGVALDVVGWIPGVDAMQPHYWRPEWKEPAWLVPASDLRPMPARAA